MDLLRRNVLGRTGIEVTELCLGTLTVSCLQADMPAGQTVPMFRRALELGINFFDTADAYHTYEHVREGLGSEIDHVVIASKTTARDMPEAQRQADRCFRCLGRDMIDVFLLHQVPSAEDFANRRAVLDYLLALKSAGRVRAVGMSTHTVEGCRLAVEHSDEIDVLFPVVNRRGLGIIDGTLDDEIPVLREAHSRGIGIYAMKPLAGGHLRNEAIDALSFVRGLDCVDSVSVGNRSVDEVELNVAIFSDGKLAVDKDRLAAIARVDRRTVVNFLCKRCGACVERCDQGAISLGEERAQIDADKCILCGYCAEVCPQFAIRVI